MNQGLKRALETCDADAVRRELQNGADPNAFNMGRQTPLVFLIASARNPFRSEAAFACAKALLDAKADLELNTSRNAWTPLIAAAELGRLEMVRFFVQAGANVRAHSEFGNTALHIAASNGRTECVTFLSRQPGVDLDALNKDGETALAIAVGEGHPPEMAWDLLESGASSEVRGYGYHNWFVAMLEQRRRCRVAARTLYGVLRWRCRRRFCVSRDVAFLVAKAVWGTRGLTDEWAT